MELAFEDKTLRTTCENEDSAEETYGPAVSAKLKARLADFRAFKNVSEIGVGSPKEIPHSPHPHFQVDLDEGYKIVFCANHVKIPADENGKIVWSKITRIKILKIDNVND